MSAEVRIATETHENAVVVPIQAVGARTERELAPEGAGAGAVVSRVPTQIPSTTKTPAISAI